MSAAVMRAGRGFPQSPLALRWRVISSITSSHTDTTLFVFIRPVILHDEKFEDLRYYSDRKMNLMELPGDYPKSEPIPLH